MTARLLDGRALARTMTREIAQEAALFRQHYGLAPGIAVVQVGEHPSAMRYIAQIERSFQSVGMRFSLHRLPRMASAADLIGLLERLNGEASVNGILVQMPLPGHLPPSLVANALDPLKDVDGVHPLNAGRLLQAEGDYFVPATPAGGMELLRRYGISLAGKRAVMVGRSNVVGRPMALLMLHEHATVTICHSRTPDLAAVTREAEILVVAVGRPAVITGEMIRPGAVVVDFGMNVVGSRVVGDVDTEAAMEVAEWVTPVPGGTGPMTNVMLLRNVLTAAWRQAA